MALSFGFGLSQNLRDAEQQNIEKRKKLLNMGRPPIYDRAALKLTNDEHKIYEKDGINPHWRFLLKIHPQIFQKEPLMMHPLQSLRWHE